MRISRAWRKRATLIKITSYHNLIQYMSDWTNATTRGVLSSDLTHRPRVPATLYNNITVKGSWVDIQNMTRVSQSFDRIVNNVSLAFPHPGVAAAAHNPRNGLLQPADLSVRPKRAPSQVPANTLPGRRPIRHPCLSLITYHQCTLL